MGISSQRFQHLGLQQDLQHLVFWHCSTRDGPDQGARMLGTDGKYRVPKTKLCKVNVIILLLLIGHVLCFVQEIFCPWITWTLVNKMPILGNLTFRLLHLKIDWFQCSTLTLQIIVSSTDHFGHHTFFLLLMRVVTKPTEVVQIPPPHPLPSLLLLQAHPRTQPLQVLAAAVLL